MLATILLVAAFVLFVLACIPWEPVNPHHPKLIAAGLACWVASVLFGPMLR